MIRHQNRRARVPFHHWEESCPAEKHSVSREGTRYFSRDLSRCLSSWCHQD